MWHKLTGMLSSISRLKSTVKLAAPWAALAAVAMAVYANTLINDFIWDDFYLILEDHTVKSLKYLNVIWTSDFFGHQEDDLVYGYYRPMVSLSYALDYAVWQTDPFGFHLTNVLLHGLATLLAALLLVRLGLRQRTALAAALLFAVHPIHTESVAWIAGRTDVLAFVLSAAAIVLHLGKRRGVLGVVKTSLGALLFAMGLLAKEMAALAVIWIGIHELLVRRRGWRRAALAVAPYLGVIALYLIWRFGVVDVQSPARSSGASMLNVLAAAPWTAARYLAWLALPVKQTAYVQNPLISGVSDIRLYAGVAIVAAIIYAVHRIREKEPMVLVLALMLAASFVPILNFVPISAPRDMGHAMAERFLYFPSLPVLAAAAAIAAGFISRLKGARGRIAAYAALAAIACSLAAATMSRNRVWKNNEVFYRYTLKSSPSALILCNLADHYIHLKRWDDAKRTLDEARKRFIDDYHYQASMALWHVAQRQYSQAIPLQKKIAKEAKRGRAVAYNNLAFLYRMTGDLDRASALLNEIIHNKRAYADVYFNLAEVELARGRTREAVASYRKALDRRPDNLQMATALASALMRTGDLARAAFVFEAQLTMHRDNPGLLNNLGVVYRKAGRLDRATNMFKRSLAKDPLYVKARLNLAETLSASGRTSEAQAELERIVERHGGSKEADAASKMLAELKADPRSSIQK